MLPIVGNESFHSYHLYVIEINNRDQIQVALAEAGVETKIHYPTLICDQVAYKMRYPDTVSDIKIARHQSQRILSLPIHQNLTNDQANYVVSKIRGLF